jgi:hypothetical protein
MKRTRPTARLFLTLLVLFTSPESYGSVKAYPAIESLTASRLFSVVVNGQPVWTEKYVSNLDMSNLPDWFEAPYVREPQEVHLAGFAGTGKLDVTLTLADRPLSVRIKPANKDIEPCIEDNRIMFSWTGPGQLVVEVDNLPPLYLFSDPEETEIPSATDPNVKYFGPGVHRPGYLELRDNETIYIAPGAVVYGGIRAEGASNIRVIGRGILDGDYHFKQMVKIENSSNIVFEGVTIRNGQGWTNTLTNSRDVEYRYVKVLGFGPSSDGINPVGSQRVLITDSFMRCTDDCVAIKAPDPEHPAKDIYVTNNIMIGFAYADGVTIGFETNAESVTNVVVRDCDILLARGGNRVGGHSGFSIIGDGPAVISNILFENIRVEHSELKLFELHVTDGTKYGTGPAGHIRDVIIRNVEWFHEGPIIIHGHDENHRVQNVVFENCTVAGEPLDQAKERVLQINEFTDRIEVRPETARSQAASRTAF